MHNSHEMVVVVVQSNYSQTYQMFINAEYVYTTGPQCSTDSVRDWPGTCTAVADTVAERTDAAVQPE